MSFKLTHIEVELEHDAWDSYKDEEYVAHMWISHEVGENDHDKNIHILANQIRDDWEQDRWSRFALVYSTEDNPNYKRLIVCNSNGELEYLVCVDTTDEDWIPNSFAEDMYWYDKHPITGEINPDTKLRELLDLESTGFLSLL